MPPKTSSRKKKTALAKLVLGNSQPGLVIVDVDSQMTRAWSIVLEMLDLRKYDVASIPTKLSKVQLAEARARNNDCVVTCKHKHDSRKMAVYFIDQQGTSINTVRSCIDWMKKDGYTNVIICSVDGATSPAIKTAWRAKELGLTIELFRYLDLQYCVVRHQLQPEHHVLTEAEKFKLIGLMADYDERHTSRVAQDNKNATPATPSLASRLLACFRRPQLQQNEEDEKGPDAEVRKAARVLEQLAKYRYDDPVVRFYGLEEGDVVKLTRRNGRGEATVNYRCVQRNMVY